MPIKWLIKHTKWILLAASLGAILFLLHNQCHCQPPKAEIKVTNASIQ